MKTETNERGVWKIETKNGITTRQLIEPSQEFLDELAARRNRVSPAELRREAYPPIDELVVALWELVVEQKPEAVDELQAVRAGIKALYPDGIDSVDKPDTTSIWGKMKRWFRPKIDTAPPVVVDNTDKLRRKK